MNNNKTNNKENKEQREQQIKEQYKVILEKGLNSYGLKSTILNKEQREQREQQSKIKQQNFIKLFNEQNSNYYLNNEQREQRTNKKQTNIRKSNINFEKVTNNLLKNKNNKIYTKLKDLIKQLNNKDILIFELNKEQISNLNLNFVHYKEKYTLIYDNYKVLLMLVDIFKKNEQLTTKCLIYSILLNDNIKCFLIVPKFNKNVQFYITLNQILDLKINNKIEYKIKNNNNNEQTYKKSRKIKNNCLNRYKFNEQYSYINEKEYKQLNKQNMNIIYKNEHYFEQSNKTFIEQLNNLYEQREQIKQSIEQQIKKLNNFEKLNEKMFKQYKEQRKNLKLFNIKFNSIDNMFYYMNKNIEQLNKIQIKDKTYIKDLNELHKLNEQLHIIEYNIKEKEQILNKDIKENLFYSNINY